VSDTDVFSRERDDAFDREIALAAVAQDDQITAFRSGVKIAQAIEKASVAVFECRHHAAALNDDCGEAPTIDEIITDHGGDQQERDDDQLPLQCAARRIWMIGDEWDDIGNLCGGSGFSLLPALGVVGFGWRLHRQIEFCHEHRAKQNSGALAELRAEAPEEREGSHRGNPEGNSLAFEFRDGSEYSHIMKATGCTSAAMLRSFFALLLLAATAFAQLPDFKETKERAEHGDAEAQYNLAVMYDMGVGAPKNYTESGKWYAKAAGQGIAEAQFQLGVRYYEHAKQAKDNYVKAFSWFYKAGLQGMAEAQYNVALMYQLGRGVPTNRVEAYKWYIISAAQGYTKSLAARENLAGDLPQKDISEGERRAAAFEPKRTFRPQASLASVNGEPPKGTGTGFFVTEDGYLVTNHHVVSGATACMVKTRQGNLPARIVKTDEKNDLALLKVIGNFRALPVGNSKEAKLGDPVFTIGFPNTDVQGTEPKLTRGDINSLAGIKDDARHFQISVPVQPGNSGGPLVDSAGNVVGVVTMRLGDWRTLKLTGALPQNVNYAVKSTHIRELVESVPEAGRKVKSGRDVARPPKFEDIVKQVEDAVAIVMSY